MKAIRVLVIGGMTRLEPYYRDVPAGVDIDIASTDSASLEARAEAADALVLVVGTVSHPAAAKVRHISRRRGTPLTTSTGPSVSRVRASIVAAFEAAKSVDRCRTAQEKNTVGVTVRPHVAGLRLALHSSR